MVGNRLKLTAGQIASFCCQLEVTAPKPGNVHRAADFEDVTLGDFLASGIALGSAIDAHQSDETGTMILSAIERTRLVTDSNTNLGIALLVCPLAKLSQRDRELCPENVSAEIDRIVGAESRAIYRAISIAQAGGLASVDRYDVVDVDSAPEKITTAMEQSQSRDQIARQYCTGFFDVFDFVLPAIEEGVDQFGKLSQGIVWAHIKTMAKFPDSLIGRKLGDAVAEKSAVMAQRCIERWDRTDDEDFWRGVGDLDFWLRIDGHRRNPGTTADLIVAALFIGVATNRIGAPFD